MFSRAAPRAQPLACFPAEGAPCEGSSYTNVQQPRHEFNKNMGRLDQGLCRDACHEGEQFRNSRQHNLCDHEHVSTRKILHNRLSNSKTPSLRQAEHTQVQYQPHDIPRQQISVRPRSQILRREWRIGSLRLGPNPRMYVGHHDRKGT